MSDESKKPDANRRKLLLAGPSLAQGRSVAPVGFTGRVFLNEKGGNRMHTYLADARGAHGGRLVAGVRSRRLGERLAVGIGRVGLEP